MGRPEVSFHTTGQRQPHDGSHIIINQAYVQYIPSQQDNVNTGQPLPFLFVHGGALTGAMWESTPDRRPGWAVLASRPPYNRPVYCIDAVDSGRSERCPDYVRPEEVEHRTAADIWWRFRFGPPTVLGPKISMANQPEPFQDLQFPLEYSDRLLASQSARRREPPQYEAEARGLRDAIAEIGECDLIAHSNGCAVSILALLDQSTRKSVRRLVMVEPGPPHTQSLEHIQQLKTLVVWGDDLAGHKLWEEILAHYEKMEGDVTVWDLPKMGIRGNSHMLMHDRNSDQIGKMILDWLQK